MRGACVLLALFVLAIGINADIQTQKIGSDGMLVTTSSLTIQIRGNGLPRFQLQSTSSQQAYAVSFNNVFQADNTGKKVGPNHPLASFSWVVSDPVSVGSGNNESVHFNLTGTRNGEPTIQFRNHINATTLDFKFDVLVTQTPNNWWTAQATSFVTCYSATYSTANGTDQPITVSSSNSNAVGFGQGTFGIAPTATVLPNKNTTIGVSLSVGDTTDPSSTNKICVTYASWGNADGFEHDPTVGVTGGAAGVVANLVLCVMACLLLML